MTTPRKAIRYRVQLPTPVPAASPAPVAEPPVQRTPSTNSLRAAIEAQGGPAQPSGPRQRRSAAAAAAAAAAAQAAATPTAAATPEAAALPLRAEVRRVPAAQVDTGRGLPPGRDEDLLIPPDDGFGNLNLVKPAGPVGGPAPDLTSDYEDPNVQAAIEAIMAEGLTGRQLRLARRMAEKYDIPTTSDYDAVRKLRLAGHDPLSRSSVLDIVTAEGPRPGRALTVPTQGGLTQMPSPGHLATPEQRAEQNHINELTRIQRDIARRRRRKSLLLWARLSVFVFLPTLIAAWYYNMVATPMYATKTEFVIQQAEAGGAAGGLGGLFSGTQFATSQDSIAVQGYLQSRDAMLRLDDSQDFRKIFASPGVDPLQRLADPNSIEAAYKIYQKYVLISYDPTEGIIKLEVSAPDPQLSESWSRELITYAEEQVNHLSERLRRDQMSGARQSYDQAEEKLLAAQEKVVLLQERNKIMSSEIEVTLITGQITTLEGQVTNERLALAQMLSNPNPNRARVEPIQRRVETLTNEINALRARLTESNDTGQSLARVQSELLLAEADVQTRQLLLTQAAQQLETARIEANRQQRYLSLSVAPVAPDRASYPRAFENTMVAMMIFMAIYLMLSLTASILREQVTT